MNPTHYQGKYIAFTTKHYKEDVVLPNFRKYLGASLIVPWIDTDRLGTFSEEVKRLGNALEIAEIKAKLGMQASRLPFGLASEGSFGPHPEIPFLPSNQELMIFLDNELGFKLYEVVSSAKTNFGYIIISSLEQAKQFLDSAYFPSHGLIVRPNLCDDQSLVFKGIKDKIELEKAFVSCRDISLDSKVRLETDMRANMNPSRINVIEMLANRLARRLACHCPACSAPGWGSLRLEKGLPCEYCGQPTEMVSKKIFGCVLCDYLQTYPREDGSTAAKQMYCACCNP